MLGDPLCTIPPLHKVRRNTGMKSYNISVSPGDRDVISENAKRTSDAKLQQIFYI